jgi:hypothetical protein
LLTLLESLKLDRVNSVSGPLACADVYAKNLS